jgi:hypothetical protein
MSKDDEFPKVMEALRELAMKKLIKEMVLLCGRASEATILSAFDVDFCVGDTVTKKTSYYRLKLIEIPRPDHECVGIEEFEKVVNRTNPEDLKDKNDSSWKL